VLVKVDLMQRSLSRRQQANIRGRNPGDERAHETIGLELLRSNQTTKELWSEPPFALPKSGISRPKPSVNSWIAMPAIDYLLRQDSPWKCRITRKTFRNTS